MIIVNDRFEITKDKHNKILVEYYMGIDRDTKLEKRMSRETYHATMEQVCNVIVDRSAEGSTVEDIIDAINQAKADIKSMLSLQNA